MGDVTRIADERGEQARVGLDELARAVPGLGPLRLSAVDRNRVQDLVDRLVARGLSASSVRNAILPLRAIYRRACARSEIAVNPTLGLALPAAETGPSARRRAHTERHASPRRSPCCRSRRAGPSPPGRASRGGPPGRCYPVHADPSGSAPGGVRRSRPSPPVCRSARPGCRANADTRPRAWQADWRHRCRGGRRPAADPLIESASIWLRTHPGRLTG